MNEEICQSNQEQKINESMSNITCFMLKNGELYLVCDNSNETHYLFMFDLMGVDKETSGVPLKIIDINASKYVIIPIETDAYHKIFSLQNEIALAKRMIEMFEKTTDKHDLPQL